MPGFQFPCFCCINLSWLNPLEACRYFYYKLKSRAYCKKEKYSLLTEVDNSSIIWVCNFLDNILFWLSSQQVALTNIKLIHSVNIAYTWILSWRLYPVLWAACIAQMCSNLFSKELLEISWKKKILFIHLSLVCSNVLCAFVTCEFWTNTSHAYGRGWSRAQAFWGWGLVFHLDKTVITCCLTLRWKKSSVSPNKLMELAPCLKLAMCHI